MSASPLPTRGRLGDLPATVPADAAAAARDTLGAAVAVATQLPDAIGGPVLQLAREAFVAGMQLTALIAAVVAVSLAVLTFVGLRERDEPPSRSQRNEDEERYRLGAPRFEPADG